MGLAASHPSLTSQEGVSFDKYFFIRRRGYIPNQRDRSEHILTKHSDHNRLVKSGLAKTAYATVDHYVLVESEAVASSKVASS